jgi:hypothetical protein
MVIALVDPVSNNGSDLSPAVITRVWNDTLVNVKTIHDGSASEQWLTSVSLFDTEEEARTSGGHCCFWPPRQ